jgi:hypothetical protein
MHRPRATRRRGALGAKVASALALALAPALLGAGAGCSKKGPAVVKSAERPATDDDIDRAPLALLPAGAIVVGRVDAHSLFSSSLGPKAQKAFEALAPIASAAGFVAERDIESVVAAAYSTQGADVAAVARGAFDPAAFDRAVEKGALGPYGTPWVKEELAGRTVYSSADVSFAPLTKKTALAGSNTGVRRAIDRLRFGAPKVELPEWASDVVTGSAPFALAGEWGDQPLATEIVARAPFLSGARAVRLSGNFNSPGVNAEGHISYPSAEAAADAEGRIRSLGQLASIASIIGLSPIHDFRSDVKGERMHVAVAVDGPYLARWLEVVPTMVPMLVPRPANPG